MTNSLINTRRDFLQASMILAGGLAMQPALAFTAGNRKVERAGLQLYTLRNAMANDFEGTLAKVAELGYKEMEFAGYFNNSGRAVRGILDGLGLNSPASHVAMQLLRADMQAQLDLAAEIGQKYIIVPFLPADERTIDHYHQHADFLNTLGQACYDMGMVAAYHNHDFEFFEQDGQLGFDILLNETDPGLVQYELDLFWAVHAGVDPIDVFKQSPGRFPAVHVKDRQSNGDMVDVGQGVIDFEAIFAHKEVAGIRHFFVENDRPADEFESVATSIEAINRMRF